MPTETSGEVDLQREMERCRAEIREAERLLRSGHPDIEGLCMALSDWSAELRILEGIQRQFTSMVEEVSGKAAAALLREEIVLSKIAALASEAKARDVRDTVVKG